VGCLLWIVVHEVFYGYAARIRFIKDVSDTLNMARTIPELASANHITGKDFPNY